MAFLALQALEINYQTSSLTFHANSLIKPLVPIGCFSSFAMSLNIPVNTTHFENLDFLL